MAKKKAQITSETHDDGRSKPIPLLDLVKSSHAHHLLTSSDGTNLIPYRGAIDCDLDEVGRQFHQEEVQLQNERRVVALQKAQLILTRLQIEELRQTAEQRAEQHELQLKLLRLQIANLEQPHPADAPKVCKPNDDFLSSD